MFRIILRYLFVATFFILLGCKAMDPCQQTEVLRKNSPDKVVDLVVVEKDCGATTAVSTLVFIVPAGKSTDEFNPIFKADHVDGLNVSWGAPNKMDIAYKRARIFSYTNFWQSRYVQNFNYIVSIREYQNQSP
jgi:hypothetical protein